jgi:hypothetical protein
MVYTCFIAAISTTFKDEASLDLVFKRRLLLQHSPATLPIPLRPLALKS